MLKNKQKPYVKKVPKWTLLLGIVAILFLASILTFRLVSSDDGTRKSIENASDSASNPDSQKSDQVVETPENSSELPPPSSVAPSNESKILIENDQFKILRQGDAYTITLYAIINNPSQYNAYRDQLREYKDNALAFLKEQGIDINKIEITYEPPEAADL